MSFSFGTPSSAPATTGLSGGFSFGANKPANTGFGLAATSQPSTGLFGATPATSTSTFGTPFGSTSFGANTTPAFGTAAPAFGTSASAFGTSAPTFGTSAQAPAFGSATPAFGAATSVPSFGSTPATGITGFAAPFGSTTTQSFGLGTGGLNFGTGTNTSAQSTGLAFAAPTTTAPSLGGFGGLSFTGQAPTSTLFPNTSTTSSIFAMAGHSNGPTRAADPGPLLTKSKTRFRISRNQPHRMTPWWKQQQRFRRAKAVAAWPGAMLASTEQIRGKPTKRTVPLPIQLNRSKTYIRKMKEATREDELIDIFYQRQREGVLKLPDFATFAACFSHVDPVVTVVTGDENITSKLTPQPIKERRSSGEVEVHVRHDTSLDTRKQVCVAAATATAVSEASSTHPHDPASVQESGRQPAGDVEGQGLVSQESGLPYTDTREEVCVMPEASLLSEAADIASVEESRSQLAVEKAEEQSLFSQQPGSSCLETREKIFVMAATTKASDTSSVQPFIRPDIAPVKDSDNQPTQSNAEEQGLVSQEPGSCLSYRRKKVYVMTADTKVPKTSSVVYPFTRPDIGLIKDNGTQLAVESTNEQGLVSQEPGPSCIDASNKVFITNADTELPKKSRVDHPLITPKQGVAKSKGTGTGLKSKETPLAVVPVAAIADAEQNLLTKENTIEVVQQLQSDNQVDASMPNVHSYVPVTINSKDKIWIILDKSGVHMDEHQATFLRKTLEKAQYILFKTNRTKPVEERQLPIFKQRPILSRGGLRVVPENIFTITWLTLVVEQLPTLWEGSAGFIIVPERNVPPYRKCEIHIPDFGEDKEDPAKWRYVLREYLSDLNPDLNIKTWPIFSHVVHQRGDRYNHVLSMGILPKDIRKLKRQQFRLHYTMKTILVRVKNYKTVNAATVHTDRDEDIDYIEDLFMNFSEEEIKPLLNMGMHDDSEEDFKSLKDILLHSCAEMYSDKSGSS